MQKKLRCVFVAAGVTIALCDYAAFSPALAQVPSPLPTYETATVNYRVVVDSANSTMLQQVRQVDSDAFIRLFADNRDRIQAGAFQSAIDARRRVDDLAQIGIPAAVYDLQGRIVYQPSRFNQVVPAVAMSGFAVNTSTTAVSQLARGYYAAVSINQEQLPTTLKSLRDWGIAEQFITVLPQPRGQQIAIGVYPDQSSAANMIQYLRRKGGLNAQIYFQP